MRMRGGERTSIEILNDFWFYFSKSNWNIFILFDRKGTSINPIWSIHIWPLCI